MSIPCFNVSGKPYEMGLQIGKKAGKFIRSGAEFYKKNWKTLNKGSFRQHLKFIEQSIPLTAKSLPKTFEELRGIADGSDVSFKDLFLINSMEMVGVFHDYERCTSILVAPSKSATGTTLIAHNEDWVSYDRNFLFMLRCHPENEPAFLAFTYGAWIPQYGVNEDGLAFVADSNTASDRRVALSQTLIGRDVFRCKTIHQAISKIRSLPRSDGHSYVFASLTEGKILETTATKTAVISFTSRIQSLVHANDYQVKKLAALEFQPSRAYSKYRRERVLGLLDEKEGMVGKDDLRLVLSDHENAPKSVCAHRNRQTDEETIATLVIDPAERSMEISPSRSCESVPERFVL